jgi:hypothetical protein
VKNETSKTFRDAVLYGTGFMKDGKNVPLNEVYTKLEKPMTDDLVKRLNDSYAMLGDLLHKEAADRIEKMEKARDGAYTERNRLVAFLASIYPSGVKKTAIPGWDEAWHGCVYIDFPIGQASWHFHDSEAHLFANLPPYEGEWDGHTTEEKYERISLAANHAKQTDELLADYIKFADTLTAHTNNQNNRIEQLEAALRDIASGRYSGMMLTSFPPKDPAVERARAALGEKKDG